MTKSSYPFTAIVGQEEMKRALVLSAVNPALGGVLIRGEKGTAKSTAVRGLAGLLPEIEVADGCPCNCDPGRPERLCQECRRRAEEGALAAARRPMPVVDLPLGATEDRVVGSLSIERALREGERRFEPGLLAAANRGVLYVDEVNLLDDHLVDVLLDSAASGVNVVEREGVSVSHPAAFILVGTMNPEEGELRPQLLDRFGLCVEVRGLTDPALRSAVVRHRLEWEADPEGFRQRWSESEAALKAAIVRAQELLPRVACPEDMLDLAIGVCLKLGVVGHRADLCLARCARTLAALRGAAEVTRRDVIEAATLVLPHRIKHSIAEDEGAAQPGLAEVLGDLAEAAAASPEEDACGERSTTTEITSHEGAGTIHAVGAVYPIRPVFSPRSLAQEPRSGRRGQAEVASGRGRYVGAALPPRGGGHFEVALDATLRCAAPRQLERRPSGHLSEGNLALCIEAEDLRRKVRRQRTAATIVFLVDASGSMAAQERFSQTKGAVLSLLMDARLRRDRVGLVSFRGNEARVLLAPTTSLEEAEGRLRRLSVGGATPLSRGLVCAQELLRRSAPRCREQALLVVVSDGRANRSMRAAALQEEQTRTARAGFHHSGGATEGPSLLDIYSGRALEEALEVAQDIKKSGVRCLVVDTGSRGRRNHMRRLSTALGGTYVRLEELRAERLVQLVGQSLASGRRQAVRL